MRMSSAYHPQSDGATERANRTVTQMLRQCIHPNQKDWVTQLPAIEFAINSARSVSTGYAPFFLNFGHMPRMMIWDSAPSTEFPAIREFALQEKAGIDGCSRLYLSCSSEANQGRKQEEADHTFTGRGLGVPIIQEHIVPKRPRSEADPQILGTIQDHL